MGLDAPPVEESTTILMDFGFMFKKPLQFILGFSFLVLGISLTLTWWSDVVVLFRGAVGMVLALAGLVLLYLMKDA